MAGRFMRRVLEGKPMNFHPEDMTFLRVRMGREILQGRLGPTW